MSVADANIDAASTPEVIPLWGSTIIVRVPGEATGGAYSVLEYHAPPGAGSGPHTHTNEDESFYVLDGALTVQLGEETIRVEPGGFVNIPVGTRHAFVSAESRPLKSLVLLRPAGLEGYFRELGAIAAADPDAPPSRDDLIRLAEKYRLKFEGLNT
jgi:quercetin dioxygenase-like cupin family protein